MNANIYYYGQKDLFTVEFNGRTSPTPKANVLAFAEKATAQGITLIIDMSHKGRNSEDMALCEELTAQHIPYQVKE